MFASIKDYLLRITYVSLAGLLVLLGFPAGVSANSTIPIHPGNVPTTAAGFQNHECQSNLGGGPYADSDVWVFSLPNQGIDAGEFVSLAANFAGHPDQTINTTANPGSFSNNGPGVSKAWIITPAGWTLTGAEAVITDPAGEANVETFFVLVHTCPASGVSANATININPGPLPTTAAGFPNLVCQAERGGGPYTNSDVWVFALPDQGTNLGTFVSLTSYFEDHPDQTINTVDNPGSFNTGQLGSPKAWLITPAGWTLTGASAVITDPAGSATAETFFVLTSTCPASEVGDSIPPILGTPSWSTNPTQVGSDTTLAVPVTDDLSGVASGEYYINTDPGVGNATPMAYGSGNLTATFGASLGVGTYNIGVRAKDVAGNWSPVTTTTLVVSAASLVVLDPSFDGDGKVVTSFGHDSALQSIARQPDGKIVAVGYATNGSNLDWKIARYNTDGSLDISFGSGGIVTRDFGSVDHLGGVAVQPDGKIVVGGISRTAPGDGLWTVARYNTDGTLDLSFGEQGLATLFSANNSNLIGLTLQSDGKIVTSGYGRGPNTVHDDILVGRFNSDGSADGTFGSGGMVSTGLNFGGTPNDRGKQVVVQSDGKIVVIGDYDTGEHRDNVVLVRYNTEGSLDNSFDGDGKRFDNFSYHNGGSDVKIQSDGKLVITGATCNSGSPCDTFVTRYNTNGSLDGSFGVGGKVVNAFSPGHDGGQALTLQSDGKVVLVGGQQNGSTGDSAVRRFNNDGTLDTTFGTNGSFIMAFSAEDDGLNDVLLQPDGKIVVGGTAVNGGVSDWVLARIIDPGTLVGPAVYPVTTNTRSISGNNSVSATVGTTSIPAGDTATVSVATGTFAGAVGCSDSKGNTYTVAADRNTGTGRLFVCTSHLSIALTGGDTVTATYPGFSGLSVMSVNAIATFASGGTILAAASASGNSAAPNSGNITVGGPAVLFGVINHNSTPIFTPDPSYTLVGQVSGGSGSGMKTVSPMFKIVTTAGSYNASGTISNGGQFWRAAIIGYAQN